MIWDILIAMIVTIMLVLVLVFGFIPFLVVVGVTFISSRIYDKFKKLFNIGD